MPVLHPEQQENQEPRHGVTQADPSLPAPSARRHGGAAARASESEPAKPMRRPRPYIQAGPPPAEPVPSAAMDPAHSDARDECPAQPLNKPAAPPRPKRKADPKLIAIARELRDRWLEEVERDPSLILPRGKYDLARALPDAPDRRFARPRLIESKVKALPAAA